MRTATVLLALAAAAATAAIFQQTAAFATPGALPGFTVGPGGEVLPPILDTPCGGTSRVVSVPIFLQIRPYAEPIHPLCWKVCVVIVPLLRWRPKMSKFCFLRVPRRQKSLSPQT